MTDPVVSAVQADVAAAQSAINSDVSAVKVDVADSVSFFKARRAFLLVVSGAAVAVVAALLFVF